MSSTNKTSNYNLNQWAADDPVLREDFNADNTAIDAALSAVPPVKLMEYTIAENTRSFSIDLSSIDKSLYRALVLSIDGRLDANSSSSTTTFYLKINDVTLYSYSTFDGVERTSSDNLYIPLSTLISYRHPSWGGKFELFPIGDSTAFTVNIIRSGTAAYGVNTYIGHTAVLSFGNVNTLNFSASSSTGPRYAAGTSIIIYGLRK